jgi:glycosyltransferase involved in cell wall biosynthesis
VNAPVVSAVVAAWNAEAWVGEAVASLLAQTLAEVEVIVVDDGSTDRTPDVLAAIADPRLRVERRAHAGLAAALNAGLALARAPLVARLDADDLALPERLGRQAAFMRAHPDVVLLGTAAREVHPDGRQARVVWAPVEDRALRRALRWRNPLVHSTVMLRAGAVAAAGGYDATLEVAQDYDLWIRLAAHGRLASLPEVLVTRRLAAARVGAARDVRRPTAERRIRWRAIRRGAWPRWTVVCLLRPALAEGLARWRPAWWRALRARRGRT